MNKWYAGMALSSNEADQPLKVATFFWEDEHTLTGETFQRVQRIRQTLSEEICCDRGLVLQLVLTELSAAELDVLEMFAQRCREVRQIEREQAHMAAFTILPLA